MLFVELCLAKKYDIVLERCEFVLARAAARPSKVLSQVDPVELQSQGTIDEHKLLTDASS